MLSFSKSLAIAALLVVFPLSLVRAAPVAPDFVAIDSYLQTKMEEAHIPGMALGIVQGDKVVHVQTFGVMNDAGKKVTPQTSFIIGSTSKSFTALAIMQLVEQGKIELDAPVQNYIPWFQVADAQASSTITVRQLLNHTSGLSIETGNQPLTKGEKRDSSLEVWVKTLTTAQLSRPVGESYEYSNANYIVLGLIVEKVSGQTYEDYVQTHIFDPLEMEQTFTSEEKALANGMSTGYHLPFGIPVAADQVPYPPSFVPVGFIISSAEDMTHYLMAQLNDGNYNGNAILSAAGIAQLHAPGVSMMEGSNLFYGMGWALRTFNDIPVIWHDGDTGHFHTEMTLIPEGKWGFILLMNASHFRLSPAFEEMVSGTTSLLVGKVPRDYLLFKRIILGVYLTIIITTVLQIVWLIWSFITLRRWRADNKKCPRTWKQIIWRVVLPLLINFAITAGFLWIAWQFIAPFWEIVSFMPDIGFALILTTLVSVGWIIRTGYWLKAFWMVAFSSKIPSKL